MTFNYKGKEYKYPNTLTDITLGQRIQFDELYGHALKKQDDGIDEVAQTMLFAVQSFSFFTGIPLDEVKENIDLGQVMNVYNVSLTMLLGEESEIQLRDVYEFNGEEWHIASPSLTPDSKMTFNEFVTSKEIVRQMEQLGKGRWHSLPYLCAIYLRKKDEPFDESKLPERLELMKNLPLDIALAVGFFLTDSMNIFLKSLLSSKNQTAPTGST